MTKPDPLERKLFNFQQTKDGLVMIYAEGRLAKTLKGSNAIRFLARVTSAKECEKQLIMAKATGQFKFGNER